MFEFGKVIAESVPLSPRDAGTELVELRSAVGLLRDSADRDLFESFSKLCSDNESMTLLLAAPVFHDDLSVVVVEVIGSMSGMTPMVSTCDSDGTYPIDPKWLVRCRSGFGHGPAFQAEMSAACDNVPDLVPFSASGLGHEPSSEVRAVFVTNTMDGSKWDGGLFFATHLKCTADGTSTVGWHWRPEGANQPSQAESVPIQKMMSCSAAIAGFSTDSGLSVSDWQELVSDTRRQAYAAVRLFAG